MRLSGLYPKNKTFALIICAVIFSLPSVAAKNTKGVFEIFSSEIPEGAQWEETNKIVRGGGYSPDKSKDNYIYVGCGRESHSAHLTGLNIPIRQNPGPGQYRYLSFAWIKWGGEQIGIKFDVVPKGNAKGKTYDYTYVAGTGSEDAEMKIEKGLSVSKEAPGNWMLESRDLWKDFGDFDITGVTFICPERRDAGFDELILTQTEALLSTYAPKVLPSKVASPQPVNEDEDAYLLEEWAEAEENAASADDVKINWKEQIEAGGFMMYPLYALAILALLITIQRFLVARAGRIAPKKLRKGVIEAIDNNDFNKAEELCNKYSRTTLGKALRFIINHRNANREAVAETAGDIAGRDIKAQLDKIYPISVIASLSPLIGLLGTVVGMIEAFGLVALYGDEGGASILSDSISKALITTAAGLIIAVPAICMFYILKNHITGLASKVEATVEEVLTKLYLEDHHAAPATEEIEISEDITNV